MVEIIVKLRQEQDAMKYSLTANSRADFIAYAPLHTFKGWAVEGMTGAIDIDFETMTLNHLEATAQTALFDTGYADRNTAMFDFFGWEKHPETSFTLTQCQEFTKIDDALYRLTIQGILDFSGIKRQLPVKCTLRRKGEKLWLEMKCKWSFKAYGLKAPRLLFMTVRDIVDISAGLEFNVVDTNEA
ncbi:MAG: hypothetical protein CSA20_09165 [Deltaproteobacteria bacterium]|nr:MAG: hypothetical protein CSA20_09165 [Deltaproteobacteria bacterium]